MATNTLIFGHGKMTLGANEMICQMTNVTLTASNTRQRIVTPCGTKTQFINEEFDIRMAFAQDWHTNGISKYLWDNFNTDVAFTFSPAADFTPSVSGTLTCPRPSLGGDSGTVLMDDLAAPVVGGVILTGDA